MSICYHIKKAFSKKKHYLDSAYFLFFTVVCKGFSIWSGTQMMFL